MPRVDWNTVPDAQDFTPLPDGVYSVKVFDVTSGETKDGDEMWTLELEVLDEAFEGRKLWDRITWSDAGKPRCKLVFSRLGLDVSQAVDAKPGDLVDKTARVQVFEHEYTDKKGNVKKGNKIPFDGYLDPGENDVVPF